MLLKLFLFWIAALIPLIEFSDPHVTKTYGVSPDKETLEILTQVANQRGVRVFRLPFAIRCNPGRVPFPDVAFVS